ncbi:MAG: mycofactocin system-associated heme/flavin dehydrogenase [Actinomycetota bacterium]|nr:MAG: mycofactocin system-associated heme/flavin dehydrogenase [Actinomycetota bacterium]
MGTAWFESVAEAQRRASRRLPPSVYRAIVAGTERGASLRDNLEAFTQLGFAPHVVGHQPVRSQHTTLLGMPVSMPVLLSPVGVQAVHPDAEVAVARAAASRGVGMGLSSFASKSVEEVVAANPHTLYQTYWMGSRDTMLARLDRARRAGVAGLVVTLDWSYSHSRDWGSPTIPERLSVTAAARFAPEAVRRPAWLLQYLRRREIPDLTTPNLAVDGGRGPTFFQAYREWQDTPPPTWDDLSWLAKEWGGPFMIKGVCRVDDAKQAVQAGATAISVSNHGGNNLDTTPAPIRALATIAAALADDDVEILLDGGIRRGGDVVKALALGAHGVMIGRAYLWGLAANGQAGVENVLDIMRDGIDSALLALGRSHIDELDPSDVVIPAGFERSMGQA